MEEKRYAPCPECGGLNGGHSSYKCPKMTLEEAQNKIIEVEQRWIKVNSRMAAGNQKSFSRLKTAIVFYQGKYTLLKVENNKLRQNATKLYQANETIKVLTYDNNRLKGEVEGLRSAVEELKGQHGVRWVKAKDRLPMSYELLHLKRGNKKFIASWDSGKGYFIDDDGKLYDREDVEWLDESAAGREDAVEQMCWAFTNIRGWDKDAKQVYLYDGATVPVTKLYELFKQQKIKV